jgi:hypothetical protein
MGTVQMSPLALFYTHTHTHTHVHTCIHMHTHVHTNMQDLLEFTGWKDKEQASVSHGAVCEQEG